MQPHKPRHGESSLPVLCLWESDWNYEDRRNFLTYYVRWKLSSPPLIHAIFFKVREEGKLKSLFVLFWVWSFSWLSVGFFSCFLNKNISQCPFSFLFPTQAIAAERKPACRPGSLREAHLPRSPPAPTVGGGVALSSLPPHSTAPSRRPNDDRDQLPPSTTRGKTALTSPPVSQEGGEAGARTSSRGPFQRESPHSLRGPALPLTSQPQRRDWRAPPPPLAATATAHQ